MNATHRLNLLLSDILHPDSLSSNHERSSVSSRQTVPSLTFAEHDYHPSSILPSNTAPPPPPPLIPRRNSSTIKHHRQRHPVHSSSMEKQSMTLPPLLNSSTLDDLFRALTLECEQYLAASTTSYQNKTYGPMIVSSTSTPPATAVDSNDDDYENLHATYPIRPVNGLSLLKTSIEVTSPEKSQIVSSRISSSVLVPSSRTFPLLSTTSTNPSHICHSTDDDHSVEMSSSSTTRRRRRRCTRKQANISSGIRSSSSDDERTDTLNGTVIEKKSTVSKRSASSIDHRQSRIKSTYDNTMSPISPTSSGSSQKSLIKHSRRRDISLQHAHTPLTSRHDLSHLPRFPANLYSPLSVLLTSTHTNSDFLDRSHHQRQSRLELVNRQPLTLLDRMHQQFYRPSSTHHHHHLHAHKQKKNNSSNNIPTHRIPSYPVY